MANLNTLFALVAILFSVSISAIQTHQLAFPFTRTIAFARLDPIVSKGQVSAHVHKFLGASRVSKDADYSSLQDSDCTTHPITADKSSYWMPAFYHKGKDGYKLLDTGDNIVYYGTNGFQEAFPDNFQMVTGSPSQTCDEGPERYFVCIKDKVVTHSTKLPQDRECDMLGGHITFPSCWDGKDFSLETQSDHLVNPIGGALEAHCPSSHPRKLPSLMMDFWANSTGLPVSPDRETYVLSFGDKEGCGLHADFMNGWKREVLQAAMSECRDFNGNMDVADCGPLKPYYDREAEAKCTWKSDVPDEDIGLGGKLLQKLVYCSPDASDSECQKQNEGIRFTNTDTIDILGIPLPIAVASGGGGSDPPSQPEHHHPHHHSQSKEPDHPKPTPKPSSTRMTRRPRPTTSRRPEHSSGATTTRRPELSPTAVGSPKPSGSSHPGPIHRPPPSDGGHGGAHELGDHDDDDDGC